LKIITRKKKPVIRDDVKIIIIIIIIYVQVVELYSFISFLLPNGVKNQKLQNIHHKTLRKAGLSYEKIKADRFVENVRSIKI
jgi:hypothetical protein